MNMTMNLLVVLQNLTQTETNYTAVDQEARVGILMFKHFNNLFAYIDFQ